MSSTKLPRRKFIAGSAATAAGAAVAAAAPANAQSSLSSARLPKAKPAPNKTNFDTFMHGVASGDPTPNAVIIWTRVTPFASAVPGPGAPKGADVDVKWEVSDKRDFSSVVKSGTFTTGPFRDYTVKVDVAGLADDTKYFYRFTYGGKTSPIGQTRTAPAANSQVEQYNIVVTSCANYECGYFAAYGHMAKRLEKGLNGDKKEGVDLIVCLGDYIYEYGNGEYAGKSGISRPHDPPHEIVSLEDYRRRYARYRTDENLQAAHAAGPWVVVWDDHETANDSWRGGAENHTEGVEGRWKTRESAAHQAYKEWLPIREVSPSPGGHIYRSLRFGDLVKLTIMDLRSYRDDPTSGDVKAPDRTILGSEQFNWLKNELESNEGPNATKWNVLGNSVMITNMEVARIPSKHDNSELANDVLEEFTNAAGLTVNRDQWDGFQHDRARLLEILSKRTPNTLVLTGDIHSEWANSLRYKDGSGKDIEIGVEQVCASISAPNVDEIVTDVTKTWTPEDNGISHLVEGYLKSWNPWVKHLDFDSHGYGVSRIERDKVTLDYYRVRSVEDPKAAEYRGATKTWEPGKGFTN